MFVSHYSFLLLPLLDADAKRAAVEGAMMLAAMCRICGSGLGSQVGFNLHLLRGEMEALVLVLLEIT